MSKNGTWLNYLPEPKRFSDDILDAGVPHCYCTKKHVSTEQADIVGTCATKAVGYRNKEDPVNVTFFHFYTRKENLQYAAVYSLVPVTNNSSCTCTPSVKKGDRKWGVQQLHPTCGLSLALIVRATHFPAREGPLL